MLLLCTAIFIDRCVSLCYNILRTGDDTHDKKLCLRKQVHRKGTTPMAKNGDTISVFDESGNEIGQTYPKRANGLIKKGRARRTSDDSIVLCDDKTPDSATCPTDDIYSEDNVMDTEKTNINSEAAENTALVPYELKRLYDKLDEIDRYVFELNSFIACDMNYTAKDVTELETHLEQLHIRQKTMLDGYMEIRRDTVRMISQYRSELNERTYDLGSYVKEQIETAKERHNALVDDLYIQLNDSDIDDEAYKRRYELLCRTTDDRVKQLFDMVK